MNTTNVRARFRWLLSAGLAAALAFASAAAVTPAIAQEDPAPAKYRGAVQLQNDDLFQPAIDAWKQFLKDYPNHRLAPYAKFNLGVCYMSTRKHADAVATFQDTVKAAAKDFKDGERAHLYLGAEQIELARESKKAELFDEAVKTLDALLKQWPKAATSKYTDLAYYYRAEANYAAKKKAAAVADYTTVAKEFPKSAKLGDSLYSWGFTLQEDQKWEGATEPYALFLKDESLKQHPLLTEVRLRYGECLLETKQFTEAEKWLQSAAETKDFPLADHATLRLAESFSRRNKHGEAADLYLSIPDKFPKLKNVDHGFANLEGGKSAYLAAQHAKARTALGKVIPLGGKAAAEAGHWMARSFLQEQKPAEAQKVVDAVLAAAKGTPFEFELMLDRADALFDQPNQRKASVAAFYEAATKSAEPRIAQQALYNAAFAAMKTEDLATALKYCDEFLAKHKDSMLASEVRFVQAESLLQSKQFDKAAPIYDELIKAAPGHNEQELWRVRLGQCSYLQKKYDAAAAAFKANLPSLKRPLLKAEASYLLGSSQIELNQHAEAVKALEVSLEAGPADWLLRDDAEVMLARALRQLKDYKKAVDHLRKALAVKDSNVIVDAHYQLAECSYEVEDYKTAAEEFQWVVDRKDAAYVPFALFGQGWTFIKQADPTKAIAAFTRLITEYPTHALAKRAYLARGAAFQQLKQFDKAEADLKKFLELEPGAPERSDVRFELGKCQTAQKKPAEAEKTFAAILADDKAYSRTPEVLFEVAWALSDQGKSADAIKRFEELGVKSPDSPLALEGLLQIGELNFQHASSKKPDDPKAAAEAKEAYAAASKAYYDVNDKAQKLETAGKIAAPKASELRQRAMHKYGWCYYHLGDFANAEATFKYQLTSWPKGEFAPDAEFMVGESLYRQSKFAGALAAFRTHVKNSPDGRFVPMALLHAAESANKVGVEESAKAIDAASRKKALANHQQALDLLEGFAKKYPTFESLYEVLYEEAQAHHYLGNREKALELYELITAKTARLVAAKSRFMIGEVYFEKATEATTPEEKSKNYQEALKNFYIVWQGFMNDTWQANALYEAARCLEALGNVPKAKERYRELVTNFANTDKAPLAKKRLEQLGQ